MKKVNKVRVWIFKHPQNTCVSVWYQDSESSQTVPEAMSRLFSVGRKPELFEVTVRKVPSAKKKAKP